MHVKLALMLALMLLEELYPYRVIVRSDTLGGITYGLKGASFNLSIIQQPKRGVGGGDRWSVIHFPMFDDSERCI